MAFTKYADFQSTEVLEVKGSSTRVRTASLDKLSDFHDYRTDDGYMYVRIRAISSRVNKNHDGWPSVELAGGKDIFDQHAKHSSSGFTIEAADGNKEYGFATFLGKPNFVDHNNSDPKRARGVVVDSKFKVLPIEKFAGSDDYWNSATVDPEHLPAAEIELLLEIDAKSFPKYAHAVLNGELDGFSMGCFLAGTPITMGDGTKKPIEEIEVGDEVLTHRGNVHPVTYTMERGYEGTIYHVEVYGQKTKMKVTEEHPIWTKRGWVFADDLTVGDHVLTPRFKATVQEAVMPWAMYITPDERNDKRFYLDEEGLWRKVTAITAHEHNGSVYNFDVDGDDSYVAADVAVHNCDVERSKCSHCGHVATNPDEYCSHIVMKGASHDFKTADGKRISRKSYENCYGIHYFEISGVFDPADETALAREVRAAVNKEGIVQGEYPDATHSDPIPGRTPQDEEALHARAEELAAKFGWPYEKALEIAQTRENREPIDIHGEGESPTFKRYDTVAVPQGISLPHNPAAAEDARWSSVHMAENPLPQSFEPSAPEEVDTMRTEHQCPVCGENMEGETCDVCGYVEPPKGMDNPDLTKARELQQADQQASQQNVMDVSDLDEGRQVQHGDKDQNIDFLEQHPAQGPGQGQAKQPGSFLQNRAQTRNLSSSSAVMGDMRWAPRLNPKLAARINQTENPVSPSSQPATNDPTSPRIIKSPTQPVTSAMRTAQELIEAANKGDTMSTQKTADGPTPPGDTSADVRTDVTGVGGVIDATNEAASDANNNKGKPGGRATVDVTDIGTTGVTDVEADKTETLPTAGQETDDSGFDKTKTTDDSGPTSTYGDSDGTEKGFTDGVTRESLEGNQNKDSSAHLGYDAKPFYDQPGLSGGTANKGTQPVDSVGKAQDRVDVLSPTATPENNSGPTSTWTGTDGNQIYRQQDPVTNEAFWGEGSKGFTSHVVACFKLAEIEDELGLLEGDKYNRVAELDPQSDETIKARLDTLSRVKTAGLKRLAQSRTAGVTRMPGAFGRRTAAPAPLSDPERVFERVTDENTPAPEANADDVHDSALFGTGR